MLRNEHHADDRAMMLDFCGIMNAELRELTAAGCPVIQVEERRHHGLTTRPDCSDAELEFQTEAFNRQLAGVDAEIWVHTCWGNPNQQRVYWEVPTPDQSPGVPCLIYCSSIATSSPSNAPRARAGTCRSLPNTRPTRRSV